MKEAAFTPILTPEEFRFAGKPNAEKFTYSSCEELAARTDSKLALTLGMAEFILNRSKKGKAAVQAALAQGCNYNFLLMLTNRWMELHSANLEGEGYLRFIAGYAAGYEAGCKALGVGP